ncbi:MAG: hypothetical protein RLY78_876, partial [Pseudomonadota bacterium]
RFAFTIPVDIPRPEPSGTVTNTAATP